MPAAACEDRPMSLASSLWVSLVGWVLVAACGGSSGGAGGGDGGGGGGGDGGVAPTGTGHWSRTEVGLGALASLGLAADGTRDLAYVRATLTGAGVLVHAEQRGGTGAWVETDVESIVLPTNELDARRPSVVRDGAGVVSIAYQVGEVGSAAAPPQVKLAIRATDTFATEVIAESSSAPVLRVSAEGVLHAAYLRELVGRSHPTYATRVGTSWQAHDVFTSNDATEMGTLDLALGPDGTPHVLWQSQVMGKLLWSTWGGAAFATEVVGDEPRNLFQVEPRAMFTPDGTPYVLHDDDEGMKAWTRTGGTWTSRIVDIGAADPEWAAAFEPSGQLVVLRGGEDRWIGTGEILRYTEAQTYQLLANDCTTEDLAIPSAGAPIAVLSCARGPGGHTLVVMERIGAYSEAWEDACDAAAEAVCEAGCGCDATECCIDSFCTSGFACVGNARGHLCGDPSVDEGAILACAPVADQGMCVDVVGSDHTGEYELAAACQIPSFD